MIKEWPTSTFLFGWVFFIFMATKQGDSEWISLSDMMTGLMLVFLLIAILMISQSQSSIRAHQDVRNEIYEDLKETFEDRYENWDITISKDLTVRFSTDYEDAMFARYSSNIGTEFQLVLNDFIPEYLGIVANTKYRSKISEIRIEGYTADDDDYIYTVELSQDRARNVLAHILNNETFAQLPTEIQSELRFRMTANGLGKSKAFNSNGDFVFTHGGFIDSKSRRVEFRIVTNDQEVFDEVTQINKT